MKNIFLMFFLIKTSLMISQAGTFDTSFDSDGYSTRCSSEVNQNIDGGIQSSGKIISYYNNYTAVSASLLRWNTNGSIDNSFGMNGFVNFAPTGPFVNSGQAAIRMVIQPDDKIIIMGTQQNNIYPNAYWIARLLPDDALDISFSGDGYRDLSFGTPQDRGTCVALQTDGRILVGGTSGTTAQFFTVARLLTNGDLDLSFGSNGVVQTPFSGSESFANSIAVQQDGKIILGGYTVNAPFAKDFAMIRYTSTGSVDTTFGNNGKVVTTLNTTYSDYIDQIIIDPQGRIIASGCSSCEMNPRLAMARYTTNGTLDNSFGTNGIVVSEIRSRHSDVTRQVDGKIILVGGFDGDIFAVLRYLTTGALDTSFGSNGLVDVFQGQLGFASNVLIQPDNKIVVSGSVSSPDFL